MTVFTGRHITGRSPDEMRRPVKTSIKSTKFSPDGSSPDEMRRPVKIFNRINNIFTGRFSPLRGTTGSVR
jgi:hypothetical protein